MKQVTNQEFEELLKGEKTVFADFWATWCAPCRMLAPIFEGLAEKYADKAVFVKVNVDESEKTAIRYGISAIPTLLLFKNGEVAEKSVGLSSRAELSQMLLKYIG